MLSMKRFRFMAMAILAALAVSLAAALPGVSADGGDNQAPPIPEKSELSYPNLGSHLDELVTSVEAGQATVQDAASNSPLHSGESVAVTLYLTGNVDDVVSFLEDNGGDPRNVGEDYIEAYVPVTLLGPVSEQPGVIRVREIMPPEPEYGPITSQGVQAHLAAAWHDAGYTGQGVKVGIIDVGFKGFPDLMGTELPSTVIARCYTDVGRFTENLADCENEDVHGTAVAEAVMDVAPGVSLYISNAGTRGDVQETARWMTSQGVSVINRSASNTQFDGPGDGTSPFSWSILNTIDRAVDGNTVWVNSAGNYATETWFSESPSIYTSSRTNNSFIAFNGSDDITNGLRGLGGNVQVYLRWDDKWDGASSNLDLGLFDFTRNEYVAGSVDYQTGLRGHMPTEFMRHWLIRDRLYGIVVQHSGGDVPNWVQVGIRGAVRFGRIEHYTEGYSINNASESANAGMLAVGAAHYWDTDTIADYSSRGPTPDGRTKPDIVGAACAEAASYESRPPEFYDGNNCWFPGTSQAAPHVAGLVALVKQANPSFTPEQVADYLKNNAAERGRPGRDNTWGYGFAELPVPLKPAIVFGDPSWTSSQLQTEIARHIIEHGYGYATELVPGTSLPLFQGLRDGDIHLLMEVRLPNRSEQWEAALSAGDILDLGTSLGNDWRSAFVIPAYLQEQYPGLNHVDDLKQQQYKSLFSTAETEGKARLESCPVDWPCEGVNRQQIEGYGLQDHVHIANPSGEPALNESLKGAYENGEPWLGYQWGTNEPALLLDLVRLEEPAYSDECWSTDRACAYEDDTILIGAHSSLPELAPDVVDLLEQWDFSVDVHLRYATKWMNANPEASFEDAALNWLANNVDSWNAWVTEDAAARILATMPEVPVDLAALVALYNATGGPNWTNSTNWLTNTPLDQWHGVTVDSNGRVAKLDLQNNVLSGEIPVELGRLSSLEILALGENELTGTIPSELANLTSLKILSLGENDLTGTIPAWLGSLTELEGLYLWGNELSGEIPAELGSLTELTELYLWGNELTGEIPADLASLSELQRLSLSDNQLAGTIPAWLGSLTELTELSLGGNGLTGEIPADLASLSELQRLSLSDNQLTGTIPAWLGSLTELTELSLWGNELTGEVPASLGFLVNLMQLHLSGNQLTGEVPASLGFLVNLTELHLSGNQLTGCVPAALRDVGDNDFAHLGLPFCETLAAGDHSATRSFSETTVAPGGEITVNIALSEYGEIGLVTETLPEGFTFVYGSVEWTGGEGIARISGNQVRIVLAGAGVRNVIYKVTAPSAAGGPFEFTGTFVNFDGESVDIGGDFTATIAAVAGTPASYDSNGNGFIELPELFVAIDDYFAGEISLPVLFEIIDFYFSGDRVG